MRQFVCLLIGYVFEAMAITKMAIVDEIVDEAKIRELFLCLKERWIDIVIFIPTNIFSLNFQCASVRKEAIHALCHIQNIQFDPLNFDENTKMPKESKKQCIRIHFERFHFSVNRFVVRL